MDEALQTYTLKKRNILFIIFIAIFSLFLGFVLNFSFEDKIENTLASALKKNRACPISYNDLDMSLLTGSIKLKGIGISRRCLRTPQDIGLKSISSRLSIPSISPLGPALKTRIVDDFSKIDISTVHGFTGHYLKLESKRLSANSINPFLGKFSLKGNFDIESNIDTSHTAINELDLLVKSKDFTIPAQSIQGFDLPLLSIGHLAIKAQIKKKNVLSINEFILGNENSPIRAKVTGDIKLNKVRINRSILDLVAEVKFSQSFLESFSILNLFLDKSKQDKQGFYKLKLTGTLGSPKKPTFL